MISDSVAMPRFRTFLVTTFAVVALLLAMAGVYGVMAYPVSQRTGELGLRMTLGCAPGGVVRLVPARALAMAGAGLVAGVGLSFAGGRCDDSALRWAAKRLRWLHGCGPGDRRASRIDPAVALRGK